MATPRVGRERRSSHPREKRPRSPPRDLISTLPEEIIHQIFALLPGYDHVVRTSVLSKRFASFSRSFPFIDMRRLGTDPRDESWWWSSFLDSASRIIMRYKYKGDLPLQKFKLRVEKFDSERDDRIDSLLQHALANCFGEVGFDIIFPNEAWDKTYSWRIPGSAPPSVCRTLTLGQFALDLQALISGNPCLEHLKLHTCDFLGKNITLSSPTLKTLELMDSFKALELLVVEAPNLRTLFADGLSHRIDVGSCKCLLKLTLDGWRKGYYWRANCFDWSFYEGQIPKLPSLECLCLSNFIASKHLTISSLSLKNLSLEPNAALSAIRVNAPNLESFKLCDLFSCNTLDISPSVHLRRMCFLAVLIDPNWFEDHLSDFPLLQELEIQCHNKHMKRVNISHEGLLALSLHIKEEDVKISINTPQLLHFTCSHPEFRHLPAITDFKCSPSLNLTLNIRWRRKYELDLETRAKESWKLWQLLQVFSGCKCINLPFEHIHEDLAFPQKERPGLLLPFFEIELRAKWCLNLMEKSIFLTCHPKILTFISPDRLQKRLMIKLHYKEGSAKTKGFPCCESSLIACWRWCLEGVTLVNFQGAQLRLRNFFIKNAEISNACIQQLSQ